MEIFLIGVSALEYWLNGTDKYYYLSYDKITPKPNFIFKKIEKIAKNLAKEYGLSLPIQCMAAQHSCRRNNTAFRISPFINHLPESSFVRLNDRADNLNVFVACPELAFIQAARYFSLPVTVLLGCMLCAMYVCEKSYPLGQVDRIPITNKKKILQYLKKAEGIHGIKRARRAVTYISDNCNSPMEVSLATIAALPISEGGYAMKPFQMNETIQLKKKGALLLGREECRCDMAWVDERLVVEYESNLIHIDKNQHIYDNRRLTSITSSGYCVVKITSKNVASLSNLDDIFFLIRKILGQRPLTTKFKNTEELRREVYKEVFFNDVLELLKMQK
ncbi:MAG: hypothetical protein MJ092_00795 [Lachnospiraceae bacterium]|nr:hypothetical protein [Lachnospiraceae bacterium]